MSERSPGRNALLVGLIACVAWLALFAYISFARGMDLMFQTDSFKYLDASRNLLGFPGLELPAYPALLALLNAVAPWENPRIFGELISLVSYVASAVLVYLILAHYVLRYAIQCALLFAFFPLIGLAWTIQPRTNALLFALLALGTWYYVRNRSWQSVAVLALALLAHKSVWPVVLILVVVALIERRFTWAQAIVTFLPLALYWLAGASHHSDLIWMLRESFEVKVDAAGFLPFGGLLGAYQEATQSSLQIARFLFIVGLLLLCLLLLVSGIWRTQLWLLAFIVSPLLWAIVINAHEYWSVFGYAAYVTIPLCFYLEQRKWGILHSTALWAVVLTGCYVTNAGFAIYLHQIAIRNGW